MLGDSQFAKRISGKMSVYRLQPRKTTVFKLEQRLDVSPIKKFADFWASYLLQSSGGRVDVLARLIVDGMNSYEVQSSGLEHSNGDMFVELLR